MKRKCKLIAGMLAVTLLSTTFAGWSAPVFAAEISAIKEENTEYLTGTYEGDEYFRTFVEDAEIEEFDKEFPKSVDLTKSEYFPAVGNQDQIPNCGYWTNYHTNLTYTYNKKNGIKTTDANTTNPNFGFAFYDRSKEDSAVIASQIGYPTRRTYPVNYEVYDVFMPTKEIWEDALLHRIDKWVDYKVFGDEDSIIEGPDDPSLKVMKQLLNDGVVFSFGSFAYQWNYLLVSSENFKGEKSIARVDRPGSNPHGISFVGYNDEIWTDINCDGKVQKAEMGAFKMVNSWGPEWCNDGYVWVAYDAINVKSQVLTAADEVRINKMIDEEIIRQTKKGNINYAKSLEVYKVNSSLRTGFFRTDEISIIKPREKNTSNCWCYISVNTGSRKEMTMSVTATKKSDGTKKTYNFPSLIYESKNLAWDGSTSSTDATMVFDLDNLIEDISVDKMKDYKWETTFGDTKLDEYSVTVKDVYFTLNGVKKYVTDVSKVPLNGTSKTYKMHINTANRKEDSAITEENKENVIIYYNNSKYNDANIHYKVEGNAWTKSPGVQMCRTDEQSGNKWKYVINLESASKIKFCFNNRANTWDNNNESDYSITEPGCYGIKSGKITKLTEPVKEPETVIKLDKNDLTLNISEEATLIPTVKNGSKDDIVWSSSNNDVAKVKNGKVTAVKEGKATITAKVGEAKVICEVKVEKRVIPLSGTLTTDGSKDNLTKIVGSKITLNALGSGGNGGYTYKFAVLNVDTGKWSVLRDFNSNSSYIYALNYAGTKQFAVTVKDSKGTTVATNRITVNVTKPVTPLAGTLKVNDSTASLTKELGSKITLNALGSGGNGGYTYKFAVLNVDTGKWSVLRDFNSNASYTYGLNYAGTKQFAVTVKDSKGTTVATNRITVNVTKPVTPLAGTLKVNNSTASITKELGSKITLNALGSGGNGGYTYKFAVLNVDTGKWSVLGDFNSNSSYIYALNYAGTKQFAVTVKDSKGKTVATNRITVKVNK